MIPTSSDLKEAEPLRKIVVSVLFVLLLLSACNTSTLSFSEIENVPKKIEEVINDDLELQFIDDEQGTYVIFHSHGEIEANLEPQDNIVTINFTELDPQDEEIKRNVYYLTMDSKHDSIIVKVNGEEKSIDVYTGV